MSIVIFPLLKARGVWIANEENNVGRKKLKRIHQPNHTFFIDILGRMTENSKI
jgi:hypothetical protein